MIINSLQLFRKINPITDVLKALEHYKKSIKNRDNISNNVNLLNAGRFVFLKNGYAFLYDNNYYFVTDAYPTCIGHNCFINSNVAYNFNLSEGIQTFFLKNACEIFKIENYITKINSANLICDRFYTDYINAHADLNFNEEVLLKAIIQQNNITGAKFINEEWVFETIAEEDEDGFPIMNLALNTIVNEPISNEVVEENLYVSPVINIDAIDLPFQ